ncbi:type II toxin-antitoxin system VapB family antitoxin [Phenylobacterium sp.]|uniref:type II toxin-antitoxin system VapB family antitoxin n=1 Tax=Phenylobacterium sp. TaxID=1871053 RepID=UPI00345CE038
MRPIQIRRKDAVRDLRELAARRGRPITDIVAEMARRELELEQRCERLRDRSGDVDATIARFQAAVRAHGGRMLTDDDFYDEDGMPR